MIAFRVSVVFAVRDAYTGKPILPSAVQCWLDGQPSRPVGKQEGYLVFVNLRPGSHRLSLRCAGYQEEQAEFSVGEGAPLMMYVDMKPGQGYRFRGAYSRLSLALRAEEGPLAGHTVWLAAAGEPEMKIAQTSAEKGSDSFRIFCRGAARPRIPGPYLVSDGKKSEIIQISVLDGETGFLERPLTAAHSRGRQLLPVQCCHTDEKGTLQAVYAQPCNVDVFSEALGLLGSLSLKEGENTAELIWKEER